MPSLEEYSDYFFAKRPLWSAKVYVNKARDVGKQALFVWRYVQRLAFQTKSLPHEFLPGKAALLSELGVVPADVQIFVARDAKACQIREHLVSTRGLIALAIHSARARQTPTSTRARVWSMLKDLVQLVESRICQSGAAVSQQCKIADPCSTAFLSVRFGIAANGRTDIHAFAATFPGLGDFWALAVKLRLEGVCRSMESASLSDFFCLCVHSTALPKGFFEWRGLAATLGRQVLRALLDVVCIQIECHFLEELKVSDDVTIMRSKRRLARVDPLVDLALLDQMDGLRGGGCDVTFQVQASRGRIKYLQHAHNVLYLDACKRDFSQANFFSVAGDPSQYRGEATQVAVLFSWQAQKTCVLPIKVISRATLMQRS